MPLPDYMDLEGVSLDLPVGGKVYRTWGIGILDRERLEALFADPDRLRETPRLDIAKMALGTELYDELLADNVGYKMFERIVLTALAWSLNGPEIAAVVWDTGVPGAAIVDHLQAQAASTGDTAKAAEKPRSRRKAG